MSNPKSAVNAILDDDTNVGSIKVYPVTLGRYALLELVDSPFVHGEKEMSMSNLMPSLYIMTHDKADLKGITARNIDRLYDAATEWADDMELDDVPEIVKSILQKMMDLMKVTPTSGEDKDEKKA